MWLSSAVLLPLGVFFTYKAVNDSAVFNADAYKIFFRRISGKLKRELSLKEMPMNEVVPSEALQMLENFGNSLNDVMHDFDNANIFKRIWMRITGIGGIDSIQAEMNRIIAYLSDTRDIKVIHYINKYPFVLNFGKKSRLAAEEATHKLTSIFRQQNNS